MPHSFRAPASILRRGCEKIMKRVLVISGHDPGLSYFTTTRQIAHGAYRTVYCISCRPSCQGIVMAHGPLSGGRISVASAARRVLHRLERIQDCLYGNSIGVISAQDIRPQISFVKTGQCAATSQSILECFGSNDEDVANFCENL